MNVIGSGIQNSKKTQHQLAQICLSQLSSIRHEQFTSGYSVSVPASSLDSDLVLILRTSMEAVNAGWKHFQKEPSGIEVEQKLMQSSVDGLTLKISRNAFDVVPTLSVLIDYKSAYGTNNEVHENYAGGYPIDAIGGVGEQHWRDVLTKEWTLDAKPPVAPLESLERPEGNPDTDNDGINTSSFSSSFTWLKKKVEKHGKHINILARLATIKDRITSGFEGTYFLTLGDALRWIVDNRNIANRWFNTDASPDNAILLANVLPGIWTSGTEKFVSPRVWKDFRALRRSDPHGFISFDKLCELAARLPYPTLIALLNKEEGEEEVVPPQKPLPVQSRLTDFVEQTYSILAFLGRNPEARTQDTKPARYRYE